MDVINLLMRYSEEIWPVSELRNTVMGVWEAPAYRLLLWTTERLGSTDLFTELPECSAAPKTQLGHCSSRGSRSVQSLIKGH